jgi:5-methylcytosine-specific restriction endonuclease McrA
LSKLRCNGCKEFFDKPADHRGITFFCSDECRLSRIKKNTQSQRKRKTQRGSSGMPQGRRDEVLARDNYRCRLCGDTNWLHAHHVRYRSEPGSTHDLSNLITLCAQCHNTVHANKHKWQPILLKMLGHDQD